MNRAKELNRALESLYIDAQLPPEQFELNLRTWRDSWLGQISLAIKGIRSNCDLPEAISNLMLSERMFVTDRPLALTEGQIEVLSRNAVEFAVTSRNAIDAVVKIFQEKCVEEVKSVRKRIRTPAPPPSGEPPDRRNQIVS